MPGRSMRAFATHLATFGSGARKGSAGSIRPVRSTSITVRPSRARRRPGAIALLVVGLGLLLTASVTAASPPVLTGAVTDQTGVLASGRSQIDAAQRALFGDTGIQLYVLFVRSTDGAEISTFAQQTGERNNLGSRDALLVVALEDRTDWL